jgi:hypothetical protein
MHAKKSAEVKAQVLGHEGKAAVPQQVEATEGSRKEARPTRVVESGWDVLDNNGVNLVMAAGATAVGMWAWWGFMMGHRMDGSV